MTEESLVTALLENYQEQSVLYRRIRDGVRTVLADHSPSAAAMALAAAKERQIAFGEIERLNGIIRPLKEQWEAQKGVFHSLGAETLKGLLASMGETVSQIINDSRQLEELLLKVLPKPTA